MSDIDEALFRVVNQAGGNAVADFLMVSFTLLATSIVVAALAIPLWLRGRRELAFDLVVVVVIAFVVTDLLKLSIDRSRPFEAIPDVRLLCWLDLPSDPSMPSGHASRAFAAATLLMFAFNKVAVRSTLLVFALGASMSRVYLGVHWPSDVIVGALVGICLGILVHALPKISSIYVGWRARTIECLCGFARMRRSEN